MSAVTQASCGRRRAGWVVPATAEESAGQTTSRTKAGVSPMKANGPWPSGSLKMPAPIAVASPPKNA
jgi:hypothetical protein